MPDELNETPRASRLHIGIFGKRNSGKSTLINALTGQQTALVSDIAGTTTDPVYKAMELPGIGPVVFIDTAGFDDTGILGQMRVEKTEQALKKTDIALIVFTDTDISTELHWIKKLQKQHTPIIPILNKTDLCADISLLSEQIEAACQLSPLPVIAKTGTGTEKIQAEIMRNLPENYLSGSLTEGLVRQGDFVLLVMPQDIQAPKGRLILPQVQTLRELLDKKCIVLSATLDSYEKALASMSIPPALIITDSQVFSAVYEKKPPESRLTSFSILFAAYKGDLDYYRKSAAAIGSLTEKDHVLIAEACTHAPLSEDIGRVKLPRLLRKTVGEALSITVVSGQDFPADISSYQLIIHCGGCMFNKKYVLSRIAQAKAQKIPMTNYGVALAYLAGILDSISF